PGSPVQEPAYCYLGEPTEPVCSWCILDDPDLAAGGKPPNYHLGAKCTILISCKAAWLPPPYSAQIIRSCNRGSSWRDIDELEVHKNARCAVNKINNSADALYPSWEPNSCDSAPSLMLGGK
ncbi:unnamed protein product, partial [Prunus brigantina]